LAALVVTREEAFRRYLETSAPYFAAVEAAGGLPWYDDPDKLARLEQQIAGISQLHPEERRKALFMRHTDRNTR
jgi:hypothetical protein